MEEIKQTEVVLEQSSNPHTLKGNVSVIKKIENMNTMVLELQGAAIVEHGQHATVRTEEDSKNIIKITQQEFNPITKALMNAFD
jgi:hypothetical protein